MRKAVCALLIGVMACSMVACGGKDLTDEGSEVTDSAQAVSSEESNTANPLFDNLVRSWNARTFTASDGTNLPFQLYMPPEYDAAKSYPCILYMHSAGVKCDDNSHIYKGEAKFLRNLENGKYAKEAIVIAPCCPEGQKWVPASSWNQITYDFVNTGPALYMKATMELFETVKEALSIDDQRLYLYGMSMGGSVSYTHLTTSDESNSEDK